MVNVDHLVGLTGTRLLEHAWPWQVFLVHSTFSESVHVTGGASPTISGW